MFQPKHLRNVINITLRIRAHVRIITLRFWLGHVMFSYIGKREILRINRLLI